MIAVVQATRREASGILFIPRLLREQPALLTCSGSVPARPGLEASPSNETSATAPAKPLHDP